MWFPGDDKDGTVEDEEDKPFFVPSSSSGEDNGDETDGEASGVVYTGSPVHRPSVTALLASSPAALPVRGSFSPDLPTTTTTSSTSTTRHFTNADVSRSGPHARTSDTRGVPSMDDLLFGSAKDRRAALSRRQATERLQQQKACDEQPTLAVSPRDKHAAAGGSVVAVPHKRPSPWTKSLEVLRGMTSADVRAVLEPFFLKKESWESQFRRVEAQTLPELAQERTGQEGSPAASSADLSTKDRCARLVNTRNWFSSDDESGADTAMDVLLPASLVAQSPWNAEGRAVTASFTPPRATLSSTASGAPPDPPRVLRPHQVEGIRFIWNTLVEAPVGQVPAVGSILAHTMGLGKTGQVIVFLHLFMQCFHSSPSSAHDETGKAVGDSGGTSPREGSGGATPQRVLIVAPKSTISSWMREFDVWSAVFPPAHRIKPDAITDHCNQHERLQRFYEWRRRGGVLLVGYEAFVRIMEQVEAQSAFDGLGSAADAFGLQRRPGGGGGHAGSPHRRMAMTRRRDEGDVTYGGRRDPFTELVVCDEAHRLKSVHLRVVAALRGLHPLRRLLLTGTPLQNHLQEYWSMMDFCVHKYFDRLRFKTFFSDSIESTINKLASSEEVQLARNKTFTLINEVRHFVQRVDSAPLRRELPPLHEFVVVLKLSPLQNDLYAEFLRTMQRHRSESLLFLPAVSYAGKITAHPQLFYNMREEVAKEASSGGGNGSATPRQTRTPAEAASRALGVPASRKRTRESNVDAAGEDGGRGKSGRATGEAVDTSDGDADTTATTSSTSRSSSDEETGEDREWVALQTTSRYSLSSLYRASVNNKKLDKPAGYQVRLEDGVKLHAAMLIIERAMQNGEKTLLFSLSTRLLDFFEILIAQHNITGVQSGALPRPLRYCRLDGTSSSVRRAEMLKAFDGPGGPDLFLLSTKAGGVGITITAATRVILVDTSFNPADDQQAVGRAYRYGQTKPVFVYRLLCLHTLEYSIFEQKLAKEWLFQTVVDESSVKRDGLSGHGMHLRQIFDLIGRTLEKLDRPVKTTPQQQAQTEESIQEDGVLTSLQPLMVSAQRYAFFLERDSNDTYGDKERAYYSQYQEQRPFSVQFDADAEAYWRGEGAHAQRAAQEAAEQAQLQQQSRSLTSLVDQLIRSRADQDPNLSRLLVAMGVRLDATTGTVQPGKRLQEQQRQQGQARQQTLTARRPATAPPQAPRPPTQTAVVDASTDSDVEELAYLMSPTEATKGQTHGQQHRPRPAVSESAPSVVSQRVLAHPPLVADPQHYAKYAPGRSSDTAIELDDDESPLNTPSA